MLYRVDILKGQTRRVICTHYWTAARLTEIEEKAEHERRFHAGDRFRLHDLHTGRIKEGPDIGP